MSQKRTTDVSLTLEDLYLLRLAVESLWSPEHRLFTLLEEQIKSLEDKIISAEDITKILDELVDEMGLGDENNEDQ